MMCVSNPSLDRQICPYCPFQSRWTDSPYIMHTQYLLTLEDNRFCPVLGNSWYHWGSKDSVLIYWFLKCCPLQLTMCPIHTFLERLDPNELAELAFSDIRIKYICWGLLIISIKYEEIFICLMQWRVLQSGGTLWPKRAKSTRNELI